MPERHVLALGGLEVAWSVPDDPTARADVVVSGELDNLSSPVLRQALRTLDDLGALDVRLDLAGITFIDSSGLGALISAWRRCRDRGGVLVVEDPSPLVRQLMDLTGISDLLLAPAR